MSLLPVLPPKPKEEYQFTNYEQLALEVLPPEQVKATNHDPALIDLMLENNYRDAPADQTAKDVYKALDKGDLKSILTATKNLSIAQKNTVVQGIYNYLLKKNSKPKPQPDTKGGTKPPPHLSPLAIQKDAKRLSVLLQDTKVDLFDLCVKLSK